MAYSDHDLVEVFRETVRIAHLDGPVGDWPAAVTVTPAAGMGLDRGGRIAPGAPGRPSSCSAWGHYSERCRGRKRTGWCCVPAGRSARRRPITMSSTERLRGAHG